MHYIAILRNGDVAISAQVREDSGKSEDTLKHKPVGIRAQMRKDSANIERHARHMKGRSPHTLVERRKVDSLEFAITNALQTTYT